MRVLAHSFLESALIGAGEVVPCLRHKKLVLVAAGKTQDHQAEDSHGHSSVRKVRFDQLRKNRVTPLPRKSRETPMGLRASEAEDKVGSIADFLVSTTFRWGAHRLENLRARLDLSVLKHGLLILCTRGQD